MEILFRLSPKLNTFLYTKLLGDIVQIEISREVNLSKQKPRRAVEELTKESGQNRSCIYLRNSQLKNPRPDEPSQTIVYEQSARNILKKHKQGLNRNTN